MDSRVREAADSVEPGVERSATPGTVDEIYSKPAVAADSGINAFSLSHPLSPASRALRVFLVDNPGVPLRSTPGFMLSPATAGWFPSLEV
jgi:hypothetical protein